MAELLKVTITLTTATGSVTFTETQPELAQEQPGRPRRARDGGDMINKVAALARSWARGQQQ